MMDQTLKQILSELMACSQELERMREQLRLLQAEHADLKKKTEKARGADKGI